MNFFDFAPYAVAHVFAFSASIVRLRFARDVDGVFDAGVTVFEAGA